jgi:hypothetical protein
MAAFGLAGGHHSYAYQPQYPRQDAHLPERPRPRVLAADSGNRERSIRSIMNTGSGDHERLLAHACMGSGERRMS